MRKNVMKKHNEPYVDQSLEATRSIEYQLLNMKENLEAFATDGNINDELAPAVTNTLETLQHIDMQLQSMRALLDNYRDSLKEHEGREYSPPDKKREIDRPYPSPDRPTSPPTFPPTYPKTPHHQAYPPPYPPPQASQMQEPYYYYPPFFNPYMYYMPPPYYMPRYYHPYYADDRRFPQDYPPFLPPYGYPPEEADDYYRKYYESAKVPTVASNEPAYSSKSKAVPSQIFRIAYYPWEQLTGQRSPMNSRTPYINMYDLGKEYVVFVELPGVEKENIDIRVDEQSVWINGKPTIIGGEDGKAIIQEHGHHIFTRQIYLPSTIIQNKTNCEFENGILKILLHKENPRPPMHKIKIK